MTNKSIAATLKKLRVAHNLTQADVASVIGVTRAAYGHYETGRDEPSAESLYKLAIYYETTTDEIMELSYELDPEENYRIPSAADNGHDLTEFLEYISNPDNRKKYMFHTVLEKRLLYYYQNLSEAEKHEMIAIEKLKLSIKNSQDS